jgi:F-type H+-transporting ATPase subunit a
MSAHVDAINVEVGEHIQWEIFGLTWNVDTILGTLIAGAIIIILGLFLRRSMNARKPGKLQLIWETITAEVERQVEDTLAVKTVPWLVPLAVTLFMFILICNWIAIVPTGHHPEYVPPPTADVNLTYALALLVIVGMHFTGVRRRGFRGYYHHMVTPHWAMFPINLIEELVRPVTLALRLFGNIFSGVIMVSLIALFPAFLLWLPNVIWKLFDMFIGLIQAFIFALLTILYFASVRSPLPEDEH